jgi:septal ring factor EnvC (AmiA/AmiB activator)
MMMLESMQGGIEIIAEGQQGLKEDLNEFKIETRNNFKRVDQRFDKINQHLKKHDKKFEQIDKRFKQIDKRFEQVDENFTKVFNSLDEIKQEVKDIRKELDQMKNQPVIKREEFEILVKRVERVEMRMDR